MGLKWPHFLYYVGLMLFKALLCENNFKVLRGVFRY
jgi:hypothetical protein